MSIHQLLGEITPAAFIEQYFSRVPFACPQGCAELRELGSWITVQQVLQQRDIDTLVVRSGERWAETRAPSYSEARALYADGFTIVIRHAERHHAQIATLAAGFAADFLAPVDVHIYCTPGHRFGFGWHYDAEDVFILQTEGEKEYSLRKNTVNPWPVVVNMPEDLHYEREIMPLMKCALTAGDWLYIPAGYWHRAESKADSISLAVGVMGRTALDLFDHLRPLLANSLLWRQRLPVAGAAAARSPQELLADYQQLCQDLSRDLIVQLQDPAFVRSFLEHSRSKANAHGARLT